MASLIVCHMHTNVSGHLHSAPAAPNCAVSESKFKVELSVSSESRASRCATNQALQRNAKLFVQKLFDLVHHRKNWGLVDLEQMLPTTGTCSHLQSHLIEHQYMLGRVYVVKEVVGILEVELVVLIYLHWH